MSYRICTATALVLAGALLLCACSPTEEHGRKQEAPPATVASTYEPSGVVALEGDAGDANTFDGMVHEFRTTAAGLVLPAGVTLREPVDYDPGTVYEVGAGMGMAHWEWFCAWQQEWLAQYDTDETAAADALTQLRAMEQTDSFILFTGAGLQDSTRELIDQAALGNPTLIEDDVTGCL